MPVCMKFCILVGTILFVTASVFGLPLEQVEFFENKIRPVLVETCYECHNSVNKAKAGLALDYRDAVLSGSDDGSVIVPGNPDESVLIWAIRHQDGYEMPDTGPKLDESVVADFEEWIRMGAPDPRDKKPAQLDLDNAVSWSTLLEKRSKWWSFQPLRRVRVPKAADADWNASAIDRFIYASLDEQGLVPQKVASPETLVRRLHLVLTGLPPKAETVEAFLKDPSEKAYEALVDKLLSSQAYGERWGRYWMDWYRFAESHGSEGDPKIPYASIYRDYIIRALNEDVPYDQLLREHIAGDLLKRPRLNKELEINESAIAPTHFRMVPYGFGVVDAYQEQITYTENQIDVVSKAMLGITVSCARCHNHKFDPISQKDFYRLYGIMISNRPGTRNIDTLEKQSLNKRTIAKLKTKVQRGMADYWLENIDEAVERVVSFSFQESVEEKKIIADLKLAARKRKTTLPTDPDLLNQLYFKREVSQVGEYHPFAPLKLWMDEASEELVSQWSKQKAAYAHDLQEYEEAKKNATFYADLRDQKTLNAWSREGNGLSPKVSPAGSFAMAGEGMYVINGIFPRGVYTNLISDKHNGTLASPNHVADGDLSYMRAAGLNGAIRMSARNYPLEQGLHPYETAETSTMQWFSFKKYKFWNEEQVHYQISTSGDKPVNAKEGRSWFGVTEVFGGNVELKELGNPLFTLLEPDFEITDQVSLMAAYKRALGDSLIAWRTNKMNDTQAEFLSAFVRFNLLPNQLDALPKKLLSLVDQYRELESEIPFPTRAPAFLEGDVVDQPLLIRGEYKQAGDLVPRQFLEVFENKAYSSKSSGRLELAEDIVGKTNTLKSRVLVNRLWGYVFGRGIVSTTDNFGHLGKVPTHPELLDHLALDFEKNGWSIKNALKQIVTSRTFRSASTAPLGVTDKDPENLYLSYYTPRRLDAEAIMDSVNSLARDEFQRGVYLKVIRNKLDPFLAIFNLPIPTTTMSKRDSTNVPAQALSMMNGEFVQKASIQWAKRIAIATKGQSIEAQIRSLFLDAYARSPHETEIENLFEYYKSMEDSDTALKNIAFALMNTKEFIYVY